MKKIIMMILVALTQSWVHAGTVDVGTQFTYQGELLDNGSPADGLYDLSISLYNSLAGGSQVDQYFIDDIEINNGLLNATLDFGDAPFDGEEVYLEISIRPGNSNDVFETLSPRQRINATPYAIQAEFVDNSNALWSNDANGIFYTDGNVAIGRTSTQHKLHVTSLKNTDDTNTAVRIDADYDGSGTSTATYGAAHKASNLGAGTIAYAIGTRSTIDNAAGGTVTYGDATLSEIDNDGTMDWINGSTVSITNNGTIGTGIGNFTAITNAPGQQMTAAYLGYSFVNNEGTITDVYGLYVDYYESGAGTVSNSYGLLIPANFNKGTVDNFAVYSASDADSYFEGYVGFGVRAPERQVHISEAMRLEPQASAPANGDLGDLYVNSVDSSLYFHDGISWKQVQLGP